MLKDREILANPWALKPWHKRFKRKHPEIRASACGRSQGNGLRAIFMSGRQVELLRSLGSCKRLLAISVKCMCATLAEINAPLRMHKCAQCHPFLFFGLVRCPGSTSTCLWPQTPEWPRFCGLHDMIARLNFGRILHPLIEINLAELRPRLRRSNSEGRQLPALKIRALAVNGAGHDHHRQCNDGRSGCARLW